MRVMLALRNDFGSVPFTSVFWESLVLVFKLFSRFYHWSHRVRGSSLLVGFDFLFNLLTRYRSIQILINILLKWSLFKYLIKIRQHYCYFFLRLYSYSTTLIHLVIFSVMSVNSFFFCLCYVFPPTVNILSHVFLIALLSERITPYSAVFLSERYIGLRSVLIWYFVFWLLSVGRY